MWLLPCVYSVSCLMSFYCKQRQRGRLDIYGVLLTWFSTWNESPPTCFRGASLLSLSLEESEWLNQKKTFHLPALLTSSAPQLVRFSPDMNSTADYVHTTHFSFQTSFYTAGDHSQVSPVFPKGKELRGNCNRPKSNRGFPALLQLLGQPRGCWGGAAWGLTLPRGRSWAGGVMLRR